MGILLILVASCFASLSNFCMRRSIDSGGTAKAFLAVQLSIAALAALLLGPIRTGEYSINTPVALLGLISGLIFGVMLITLGRALEKGPPGLTFATLNASTVMPAVVMTAFFGAAFGFIYTPWHAVGSLLVLAGLFWAGKGLQGIVDRRSWIVFSLLTFILHILFLVLMQWRALILNWPRPEEIGIGFASSEIGSPWFMFFIYLTAAVMQIGVYLFTERRNPKREECFYGLFGGIGNSLSTFFLIWATEAANALENAVLFPVFSIAIIIICNVWGQRLYQERVNWKACQVCLFGLLVGTVDWSSFLTHFGF